MAIKDFNIEWVNEVPHIQPKEVQKIINKVTLVDVRTKEEFEGELSHIEGSLLIPLGDDLEAKLRELPKDIDIVFICRSSARSGRVTEFCRKEHINQNCLNMSGGMLLWNELKLPVV